MHDFDQLFGCQHSGVITRRFRINHVLSDVILDHLGDKSVQGATARSGLSEHVGALLVRIDGALDRLDLPTQTPQAKQQLFLFLCHMLSHARIHLLQHSEGGYTIKQVGR